MIKKLEDIDHENTDEIICPWCGKEVGDSWEMADDGKDETCGYCEKQFDYNRVIDVTYSTMRKKCEECEYELDKSRVSGTPYIYDKRNWCVWECKICKDMIVKTGEIAQDGKPYIIPIDKKD